MPVTRVFFDIKRSFLMARTPTGTQAAIATAFAAALPFTAATNASETVLTVVGSTLVAGDFVEVTSGWGRINNRIYRLRAATATALTLEGADTTSTTLFPAGLGAGSVRRVTTWQNITQQLTITSSGGDPKTVNFTFVETDDEQTVFDGNSATQYMIDLDADLVGTAAYNAIRTLSDSRGIAALRLTAPSGALVLLGCTLSINENPSMSGGQIMANKVTFFGRGRVVRYAS
jgi:Phage tail tube protein, TTP